MIGHKTSPTKFKKLKLYQVSFLTSGMKKEINDKRNHWKFTKMWNQTTDFSTNESKKKIQQVNPASPTSGLASTSVGQLDTCILLTQIPLSHAWSRVRAFGTTVVMNTPQSPDFFLPPTPASGAALKACYLFDVFHSSCHHQAAHHFHEIIPFLKA